MASWTKLKHAMGWYSPTEEGWAANAERQEERREAAAPPPSSGEGWRPVPGAVCPRCNRADCEAQPLRRGERAPAAPVTDAARRRLTVPRPQALVGVVWRYRCRRRCAGRKETWAGAAPVGG
jgi:hypothetical protein